MYPHMNAFGRVFSSFGLMALLAFLTGGLLTYLLAKKKGQIRADEALMAGLIAICGGVAGAFLLRPVIGLFEVLFNWQQFRDYPLDLLVGRFFGEIIFYGGLIGGLIATLLYCARFQISLLPLLDLFAPTVALAHGIGRIGCLLAGCCYGIEVRAGHVLAIRYPLYSLGAPPDVPLLAVPLIEATLLACLSLLLAIVYVKSRRAGLSAGLYLLLYPAMRFILEFFRGDVVRGGFGSFSTSQLLSLALFCLGIFFFVHRRGHQSNPIS